MMVSLTINLSYNYNEIAKFININQIKIMNLKLTLSVDENIKIKKIFYLQISILLNTGCIM